MLVSWNLNILPPSAIKWKFLKPSKQKQKNNLSNRQFFTWIIWSAEKNFIGKLVAYFYKQCSVKDDFNCCESQVFFLWIESLCTSTQEKYITFYWSLKRSTHLIKLTRFALKKKHHSFRSIRFDFVHLRTTHEWKIYIPLRMDECVINCCFTVDWNGIDFFNINQCSMSMNHCHGSLPSKKINMCEIRYKQSTDVCPTNRNCYYRPKNKGPQQDRF